MPWEKLDGTYKKRFGVAPTTGVKNSIFFQIGSGGEAELRNYDDSDYVKLRAKQSFIATGSTTNVGDWDHLFSSRNANGILLVPNGTDSLSTVNHRAAITVETTGGQLRLRDSSGNLHLDAAPGGMTLGSPTGGAKGAGTLNAVAVYDDNTLLTCYPLELAVDGEIDQAAWDARGKNGVHQPMRDFVESRQGMINVDTYITFWTTNKHLPNHCSPAAFDLDDENFDCKIGCLINCLTETVDLHAVHTKQLRDRIAQLQSDLDALETNHNALAADHESLQIAYDTLAARVTALENA